MQNISPYSRNINRLTLNADDRLYTHQGGEYSLVNLIQLGDDYSTGFMGSVTFGVEIDGA